MDADDGQHQWQSRGQSEDWRRRGRQCVRRKNSIRLRFLPRRTVTIAHEDSPEKLTVVQTLKTETGARTMALDPTTHNIYLPSAKFEAPTEGKQRPRMVAGSFKV